MIQKFRKSFRKAMLHDEQCCKESSLYHESVIDYVLLNPRSVWQCNPRDFVGSSDPGSVCQRATPYKGPTSSGVAHLTFGNRLVHPQLQARFLFSVSIKHSCSACSERRTNLAALAEEWTLIGSGSSAMI
jgi:hypothetical protein